MPWPFSSKKGKKNEKSKAQKATLKVVAGKKKPADALSNEDNLHQHLHYRFRYLNGDPLLIPSKSTMTKESFKAKHQDTLSQGVLDGVLASQGLAEKGIQEKSFVDTFGNFFLSSAQFNNPQEKEKAMKQVAMLTFDAITRTTQTTDVTVESLTKFLDTCTPLSDDQRRSRTRQLRTWFAQNVDQGIKGKLTKVDFYKKISQFIDDDDYAHVHAFDSMKKDIPKFPETAHAEKYLQGIEDEDDGVVDAPKQQSHKSLFHWTKTHKHVDCKFPFQVYAINDYKGDHKNTELSFKKGNLIKVSGECNPDGTGATDVPRTSKRVNEILDNNYPVYDPSSNKCWIGEVVNFTPDPNHHAKYKVGHFPIKLVQPADIYFDEQEKARLKRVADRQAQRQKEEGNNTARSQRTASTEDDEYEITFNDGSIGLQFADKNGEVIIAKIEPNTLAGKEEDIAEGDIVVAINDIDVEGKTKDQVEKMLGDLPRPVKITFLMGDEE